MSEPFELRLLLSLKNDKNILSYSLLYRAFHNDCWQDAVPWLELSCTCFSLSQMQDILTSEPVPLVDSLLSTLIFYNNRINGQHLCLLLPCAWHIGFMRYSGDGGIFANLQLDLAFKIPEPKSQCEVMQYAEHTSFFLFFFFSLFPGRYLLSCLCLTHHAWVSLTAAGSVHSFYHAMLSRPSLTEVWKPHSVSHKPSVYSF